MALLLEKRKEFLFLLWLKEETKKKLAEYVFKQYQDGELTDSALVEFCDKMQELRDEIDELGREIDAVRAEYEEKASDRAEERL